MDKDFNHIDQQKFSLDGLLDSFKWDNIGYHENGSSQGIPPRESSSTNGINSSKCVKDDANKKIIQGLINILNTAFKDQEEKLVSESFHVINDTKNVIIGEKGITEWILMSKVSKIDSSVLKDFLKKQKSLSPYDFYKLTIVFDSYLTELSKKLKMKPQNISNEDLTADHEFIQKFVKNKFLETKFNKLLQMINPSLQSVITHQQIRAIKINHPLINNYFDDLKTRNVSKGRRKKMQTDSKRIVAWLCTFREFQGHDIHTLPLMFVRKEHLMDYKSFLTNKARQGEYTLYSCKQHFKNAKTLFKRLYQLDLIPSDITENISNINADDYFYRDLPTDKEIVKLFVTIRTYSNEPLNDCLAFAFMAYLGFRCCELVGLKWENINEETRTLTLKSKGKNKYHTLPIPDIVLSLIKQYPQKEKSGYVFKSKTMKQNSWHISIFKKFVLYKELAGWNYQNGVHILRHWFVSQLASQNIELGDLRTLARHDSLATTSKYLHFNDEELKNGVNQIFEGDDAIW